MTMEPACEDMELMVWLPDGAFQPASCQRNRDAIMKVLEEIKEQHQLPGWSGDHRKPSDFFFQDGNGSYWPLNEETLPDSSLPHVAELQLKPQLAEGDKVGGLEMTVTEGPWQGGFGAVYILSDANEVRRAWKKPSRSTDPRSARALLREAFWWKQLRHENIVELFDDFLYAGFACLLMEPCLGTVREWKTELVAGGGVSGWRGVMRALEYLHGLMIMHGDVKPPNLLVKSLQPGRSPQIKLCDFDSAGKFGERLGSFTPGYLARYLRKGLWIKTPLQDVHGVALTLCDLYDPDQIYQIERVTFFGISDWPGMHREITRVRTEQEQQDRKKTHGAAGPKPISQELAAIAAIKDDPILMMWVSDELKNDKEVAMAAVEDAGSLLKYASDELKNDKEVAMAAVENDGSALEYASDEMKNDKEVVLAAVRNRSSALKYASDELKNDKEVAMAAVEKDGLALKYASDELKNDKEVAMAAAFRLQRVVSRLYACKRD